MLFTLSSLIAALALVSSAAPVAQSDCASCPSADLAGNFLVAGSGGTPGVPRFCGYSPDKSGAAGPSTFCFYGNGGSLYSYSNALCPLTTTLVTCQWP